MVVYQESFDRHNGMERRLFLNGKSYIQRCDIRDREVLDCENDLTLQVVWDYEHYPSTDESLEFSPFNHLRYGEVADQVFSLCRSKFPNHTAMTLYDIVQRTIVATEPLLIIRCMKSQRWKTCGARCLSITMGP